MTESSSLLRVPEVAALLGVSDKQCRNMCYRGQLPPPLKVPGLGLRWRRADLEAYLAKLKPVGA